MLLTQCLENKCLSIFIALKKSIRQYTPQEANEKNGPKVIIHKRHRQVKNNNI